MSSALVAASQTLQAVLRARLGVDPILQSMFEPIGSSVVSLASPDGMVMLKQTGVSIWLYRLARDEQRLNQPPRRSPPDFLSHVPLPMRLHYLVTPMMRGAAGDPAPETDQQLLGLILRIFHDQPLIAGADLAGALAGTDAEIAVRFESADIEEIARIWDTLDEPYRTSLCYEVGLVEVASEKPDETGPVVRAVWDSVADGAPLPLPEGPGA